MADQNELPRTPTFFLPNSRLREHSKLFVDILAPTYSYLGRFKGIAGDVGPRAFSVETFK